MAPQPYHLSEDEKVALAIDLRRQQQQINRQLDALGIPQPEDEREKRRLRAPDGGPQSEAHKWIKPQLIQTVEVTLKTLPGNPVAIIERQDFDESLHERVILKERKRTKLEEILAEKPRVVLSDGVRLGTQTRDQLLTMTVPVLRAMPEIGLMSEVPDRKEALVEEILRVRDTMVQ